MSRSDFPLPATDSIAPAHPRSADIRSTYAFVLDAERAALSYVEGGSLTNATTNAYTANVVSLVCARIVGYLIIEPLNETARAHVLNEVKSCHAKYGDSQEELYDSIYTLGTHYLNHFIRPFKKYKGRTPTPSGHVSCPSFDRKQEFIKANLVSTPTSHSQLKINALIRDGYRCMVTGKFDSDSLSKITELAIEFRSYQSARKDYGTTNCCHIIPASTNMNLVDDKAEDVASVWTVLSNFGEPNLVNELRGANTHRLENILTLDYTPHNWFDQLNMWFDKVDPLDQNDHRYFVRLAEAIGSFVYPEFPKEIEFVNHAPDFITLPLPDYRYLRIHAACAKIAHLSGASEYIDQVFQDIERMPALANDGSSADVLSNALICLADVETY
ncbi:hypothetical protein QCA50_016527 [Cerrena zonata]|uniref:HNH nuclease domain-containing protein n=1 Tax=Cerrena zonata TaxID=2478898 RepID=A0AAW0FJ90_9APHY